MRWNLPSRLGRVFLFPPPSLPLCLSASLLSSFGTAIDSCCWESDTQGFGRAMEHEASSGILLRVSLGIAQRSDCPSAAGLLAPFRCTYARIGQREPVTTSNNVTTEHWVPYILWQLSYSRSLTAACSLECLPLFACFCLGLL